MAAMMPIDPQRATRLLEVWPRRETSTRDQPCSQTAHDAAMASAALTIVGSGCEADVVPALNAGFAPICVVLLSACVQAGAFNPPNHADPPITLVGRIVAQQCLNLLQLYMKNHSALVWSTVSQ